MSRTKLLFPAIIAAVMAACSTDRPTASESGYTSVSVPTASVTSSTPTFKVQVGSTWYALSRWGDYITTNTADSSFRIKSVGVVTSFTRDQVAVDSVGLGVGGVGHQMYLRPPVTSPGSAGDFLPASSTSSYVDVYGARTDTLKLDSVTATHLYFHVRGAGNLQTFTDAGAAQENTGSFRFYACSTTPTCSYNLTAPTNATLANNGPSNAKISWSNNGDTVDSTEIWFGKEGQETKQSVQPNSTTSYVVSFSGPGIYDAWVFHRFNYQTSTNALTNQLFH
jgi:hypothetical protein